MVIGFSVSCMNRLWQIEETLPINLAVLEGTGHFLALCNYNSADRLDEYVRERCAGPLQSGTLLYFHTRIPTTFHASKAKNAAHRLALRRGPDVLFNLDADNFIAPETIAAVATLFEHDPGVFLHQWSEVWGDGTFGRIAMAAHHWMALGGYDESLREMAWQDIDLLFRARAAGLRYRLDASGVRAPVQNSLTQKLASTGLDVRGGELAAQARLRQFHQENMVRSLARPIVLDPAEQERYQGILNLQTETTL
jgi:hypothetical protein